MKKIDTVPAYFIRLPWQIILRYVGAGKHKDFDAVKGSLEDVEFTPTLDEKDFNAELGITYQQQKQIMRREQRNVCLSIERHWYPIIHGNNNTLMQVGIDDFHYLATTAIKKKPNYLKSPRSRLQQEIDTALRKGPYTPVKVSIAKVLCGFALHICKHSAIAVTNNEEAAIPRILSKLSNPDTFISAHAYSRQNRRNEKVEAVFPREFQNSDWQCFERKDTTQGAQWGISVSIVSFGQSKNENFVRLYDKIDEALTPKYKGSARIHQYANYLEISLESVDTPGKPAFFLLKISEKLKDQTLMIGFSWKYSRHFGRYLAKTVVFRRPTKEDTNIRRHGEERLIPYNWAQPEGESDEKDYSIPDDIRRFLWNRKRNRMSMPTDISTLSNMDSAGSLYWWLQKRMKAIDKDVTLRKVEGYYLIYYDASDPTDMGGIDNLEKRQVILDSIRTDQIRIHFNDNAVGFEATYKSAEVIGKETFLSTYQGKVRRFAHTIEVVLEQEEDPVEPNKEILHGTSPEANLAYLSFTYSANAARRAIFSGTLNRINETQTGPISYRCLIIKDPDGTEYSNRRLTDQTPDFIIDHFVSHFGRNSIAS